MHGFVDYRRRSRCRASQGTAEEARRGARTMRARRLSAQGCAVRRPRRPREGGEPGFDARCVEAHLAPASARTWMCGPESDPWMAVWLVAPCESDHRVRCLAFLVTFWALRRRSGANSGAGGSAAEGRMPGVMPKSNRLAEGETKLCTSGTKIKMDYRLRGND